MRAFVGGATDRGRVRQNNEDSYGWRRPSTAAEAARGSIFAVADGVGGAAAGEAASQLAIDTVLSAYYAVAAESVPSALRQAVAAANAAVCASSGGDGRGSTLVAAAVVDDTLHVANVGDSRLYLIRDGSASQITLDHSWVQEQVRAGQLRPEEARGHPWGNVITRSLGLPEVVPDVFSLELEPEDRIVICSDGLVRHVADAAIGQVAVSRDEQGAADELVRLAKEGGGTDNITVVVVRIARDGGPSDQPARPVLPASQPVAESRDPGAARPRRSRAWLVWPFLALLLVALAGAGGWLLVTGSDGTVPVAGSPVALAVGPDGSVFLADQAAGEVAVYLPGELTKPEVRLLGEAPAVAARWPAGESGAPAQSLTGLAVSGDGTVFVADGGANRIRVFSASGQLLTAWGGLGSEAGQLNRPSAMAIGPDGLIYVADSGNRRIESFDARGGFHHAYALGSGESQLREVVGLAVGLDGGVFVADAAVGRVVKLGPDGQVAASWGGPDSADLSRPRGLGVGSDGSIYLADPGLHQVRSLVSPAASEVWRSLWPTGAIIDEPTAVAADPRGNLLVLDPRGGVVHVIRLRRLPF